MFVSVAAASCTAPGIDPPIERTQLEGIVLARADSPLGTVSLASVSGPSDLDSFARDELELERLRDEGFILGHFSLFVPEDQATPVGPLEPGEVVVQQIAGLFGTGGGADSAMVRFVDDLKIRQVPDAEDVSSSGLGDHAFGLAGTTPGGETIQMFVWRERNLILFVSIVGDMARPDVRSLTDELQSRAEAA